MEAPKRTPDPAGDKRRALKLAAHAAKKFAADERARNATIRFAADNGASLREIASATGLTHMTVKRILERTPAEQTVGGHRKLLTGGQSIPSGGQHGA